VQVLHERFADDPTVSVLAVQFDDRGDPAAYFAEHGCEFRAVAGGGEIARAFGVTVIPTFIVVDPEGRVVRTWVGRMTDEVRDEIERAAIAARGG